MTREEITNEIKCLLSELNNGENAVSYLTRNDVKWLNENIKALEQEPIIDKIRAEIEKTFLDDSAMQEHTVEKCLRIIDMYAKSEEV